MTIRLIIFDLDGTLVDSLADIATSVDAVLSEQGLPTHGRDAYRAMVGEGLAKLVERAIPPEADFARALAAARQRYAAHCLDETGPYPGVLELLAALRGRGLALAVLSNKPDPLTRRVVDAVFGPDAFARVIGERPGLPKKPDPGSALEIAGGLGIEPARALLVGDTPIDVETAASAGMTSVGVTWGFRSAAQLREAGADHLIDAPAQLLDLLARFGV